MQAAAQQAAAAAAAAGAASTKVPRGPLVRWSSEEDELLKTLVSQHGEKAWKEVATALNSCSPHERSATAIEQHYRILTGQRQRSAPKNISGCG